ncbi:MAG: dihydroneopterin aldolase [Actinomycetota bacterium]|nr:dihydroneopterin aldolase [Actinomycetota bacterium]
MDRISISDLRVDTRIGVTEEERAEPRTVVIRLDIWADLDRPGISDELGDTVDYHSVTRDVADLVRSTEAKLLEHLAERIAALITGINGVRGITVEVIKESPPISEDVRAVSVRIERLAG